jgi:hypothetical protein
MPSMGAMTMTRGMIVPRIGFILVLAGVVALAAMATGHAQQGLPLGKENTVVLVYNAGNANADIVMDVYTTAGTAVPAASRAALGVAPGGIANFSQATNTGLQEGFRGVGVLSANQPIFALLVRDILRAGQSTNAKSYSLANATSEGGHTLAGPLMFNQLGTTQRWNSRASIVNVGTSTACVRATWTLMPGQGGSTGNTAQTVVDNGPGCAGGQGYPIAPGAQLTLSREAGDTNFPASTFNNQMTGLFEVLNPSSSNRIAGVVDIYRDTHRLLGSYNLLVYDTDNPSSDDVGTDVIAPIAMKSTSGFYTVIGVVNLDTSAPANVQIQYIGNLNDGTGASYSQTVNLGQVEEGTFHSTYSVEGQIAVGFVGYARITSDRPVAVSVVRGKRVHSTISTIEPIYTAVNGVPIDRAATEWSSPLYFRRFAPGAPPTRGYNSWVQVQVADRSTANVTLRYVGDPAQGCPVGPYQLQTTVTDSKVFYANLDSSPDNGFPAGNAPSCFFGGLTVTADKDIIVISQVGADKFPGGDSEGVTNAFPLN